MSSAPGALPGASMGYTELLAACLGRRSGSTAESR